MVKKILLYSAKDDPAELIVVKKDEGFLFIIMCHEMGNSAFYVMNTEEIRALKVSLGVNKQGFRSGKKQKMFIVDGQKKNKRKIQISLSEQKKDKWWVYLPKEEINNLISFLPGKQHGLLLKIRGRIRCLIFCIIFCNCLVNHYIRAIQGFTRLARQIKTTEGQQKNDKGEIRNDKCWNCSRVLL